VRVHWVMARRPSAHSSAQSDSSKSRPSGTAKARGAAARPKAGGAARKKKPANPDLNGLVRLQRVMADAGLASRRACELLIQEGRVRVNGTIVRTLPVLVDPETDRIEVDGRHVPPPERHIYIMLNKPTRTISTVQDEPGAVRRTVLDLVDHPSRARLYPVGRLDFDTTGLVLLTNDGELANRLTHPRFGVEKTYHAVVKGLLDDEAIAQLEQGIYLAERRAGRTVGGTKASHVSLSVHRRDRERTILELTLKEGRNRQVRRMLAAVGAPVKKLERIAIGPVKLSKLAIGQWRELTVGEVGALRKACRGPKPTETSTTDSADSNTISSASPVRPVRAPVAKSAPARPTTSRPTTTRPTTTRSTTTRSTTTRPTAARSTTGSPTRQPTSRSGTGPWSEGSTRNSTPQKPIPESPKRITSSSRPSAPVQRAAEEYPDTRSAPQRATPPRYATLRSNEARSAPKAVSKPTLKPAAKPVPKSVSKASAKPAPSKSGAKPQPTSGSAGRSNIRTPAKSGSRPGPGSAGRSSPSARSGGKPAPRSGAKRSAPDGVAVGRNSTPSRGSAGTRGSTSSRGSTTSRGSGGSTGSAGKKSTGRNQGTGPGKPTGGPRSSKASGGRSKPQRGTRR
jgi:23S rRNA pseudouridine2605 synthase